MFRWPLVIIPDKFPKKGITNLPLYSVPATAKIQKRGNETVSQTAVNAIISRQVNINGIHGHTMLPSRRDWHGGC